MFPQADGPRMLELLRPERELWGATKGTITMMGRVTLVGAGELLPAMSSLHRQTLRRIAGTPRPVFVDTAAGFETNVDAIVAKAVDYYGRYLQTELRVARYRHAESASAKEVGAAVAEVRAANLVFAGPGSPTYAIRHWRHSAVWEAVVRRFLDGVDLLFASAASIAVGRYALPVYEIYKAGEDPYWVEGLDLLGCLGLSVAVVPHFNDSSGGDSYDTRFCYMGAERFARLRDSLPADVTILGIDAYTAVCLDPATEEAAVSGKGGVTLIGDGAERRYEAGSRVPFAALRSASRRPSGPAAAPAERPALSADPIAALGEVIERAGSLAREEKVELLARLAALREGAASQPGASDAPLVDLVLELREGLRAAKRFDLADRAREALADLGFDVGDTPEGARWTRR